MLMSYSVSWPEWTGILATCTISGTVLGAGSYWALHTPRPPLPCVLPVAVGALVVAFVFALVASVVAWAILLILVAQYGSQTASRLELASTGATAGAVLGMLHPLVLLVAVVGALSPESAPLSVLPLGVLVGASGAVAGALIVPRYVPTIRARI